MQARPVDVEVDGRRYEVKVWLPEPAPSPSRPSTAAPSPSRARRPSAPGAGPAPSAGGGRVVAPMQGTIVEVLVAVGDTVAVGQGICVLEAMKMENLVECERAGRVAEVRVVPGDNVGGGDVLVVIG
jgi:acetyl-CoA/propionyl-CoA carboxylase biotin carboxyl carrier protein